MKRYFPFFCLALLSLVPSLLFPQREWIYDDGALLFDHAAVRHQDYHKIWSQPYWGELTFLNQVEFLHRPLFLTVLAALRPYSHWIRTVVWVFHFGTACLVFLFLRRPFQGRVPPLFFAYFAMALFLFHPAHVEVTVQAIGLMDILTTFFGALAFYLTQISPALGLASIALAPGWKETGYFWLLAYFAFLLAKRKFFSAFWVACVGIFWLGTRVWALGGLLSPHPLNYSLLNPLEKMKFVDAFLSRIALLGHYLRLFFFPRELFCDYSRGTLPLPGYVLQIWFLLGIAGILLAYKHRRFLLQCENAVLVAALSSLFPALHIVQNLKVVFAERFAYGWVWGLCLLIGRALVWRKGLKVFLAVILVAAFARTTLRYRDWVDGETLFSHDLRNRPFNAKLHFNLGVVYGGQSQWEKARDHLLIAVQIAADFIEAHKRLGMVYERLHDDKRAKEHFAIAEFLSGG
jgi:hypothetical protein